MTANCLATARSAGARRSRRFRRVLLGPVLGVAGVVGADHGALAAAFHQGPALVALLVVVVTAVAVEPVEEREVGLGPLVAVVPLPHRSPTALDRAGGKQPLEGALLVGRGAPSGVGH